jgi:hypothetical protein
MKEFYQPIYNDIGKNIKKSIGGYWGNKCSKSFIRFILCNKYKTKKIKALLDAYSYHIINIHDNCTDDCPYKEGINIIDKSQKKNNKKETIINNEKLNENKTNNK